MNRHRTYFRRQLVLLLALPFAVFAQPASKSAAFDVASVKLNPNGANGGKIELNCPGGEFDRAAAAIGLSVEDSEIAVHQR